MSRLEIRINNVMCFCTLSILWKMLNCTLIKIPDPGFDKQLTTFTYVTEPLLDHTQAAIVCQEKYHGRLVTVTSELKERQLVQFMDEQDIDFIMLSSGTFWIGLSWMLTGRKHILAWNDGNCTEEQNVTHFKDKQAMAHNASKECYLADGTKNLQWLQQTCQTPRPFLCESQEVQVTKVNFEFQIVFLNSSDVASCQSLCLKLNDCFITSVVTDACIVGLSEASTGAYYFETRNKVQPVFEDAKFFDNFTKDIDTTTTNQCTRWLAKRISINTTNLQDHVLIDGTWAPASGLNLTSCQDDSANTTPLWKQVAKKEVVPEEFTVITDSTVQYIPGSVTPTKLVVPATNTRFTQPMTGGMSVFSSHVVVTPAKLGVSATNSRLAQLLTSRMSVFPSQLMVTPTKLVVPATNTRFTHPMTGGTSIFSSHVVVTPTKLVVPATNTRFTHPMTGGTSVFSSHVVETETVTPAVIPTTTVILTTTSVVVAGCSEQVELVYPMNYNNISVSTKELVESLKVNPATLTQKIRSKSSAENKVISAVILGSIFSFVCVGFLGVVILSDILKIIADVKNRLCRNIKVHI